MIIVKIARYIIRKVFLPYRASDYKKIIITQDL